MTWVSVEMLLYLTCCVVFFLFNSQGGTLFKATLLAKENGGKVKRLLH